MKKRKDYRGELNKVIDAWEVIGGGDYPPREVERWLANNMKPAMDSARKLIGRKIPVA